MKAVTVAAVPAPRLDALAGGTTRQALLRPGEPLDYIRRQRPRSAALA
jgi:hypothetical protein